MPALNSKGDRDMGQPDLQAQLALMAILSDTPTEVPIPRSRKKVKITFLKDYTLERVTKVLLERQKLEEEAELSPDDALKSAAKHPYFNLKIAVLCVLNSYVKIRLFFPFLWRWWAYVRGFDEAQIAAILDAVKKKTSLFCQLYIHNTKSLKDMRMSVMAMTKAEVTAQSQAAPQ